MDDAGLLGNRNAGVSWHGNPPGPGLVPKETQMLVVCQINLGKFSHNFVDISHKSLEVEL